MNLEEVVAARRSIRAFDPRPVPRADVERAVALAVQAPAPHHSAPWRFALVETHDEKTRLSASMGARWRDDLGRDGFSRDEIDTITGRSHRLLTSTPLLTIACADMTRAHTYTDENRRLAEWTLFAHSIGAALQTYMLALAERGIASCWISAPVFCRDIVRETLSLDAHIEPQALVLVGYPSPEKEPRPRAAADARDYILGSW
ncbi:MAG TPA: nitroreductase family protein [Actinomycetota bacterium]|nr:nitroreductase family protein [Actinomycetota bacterium]